MPAGDFPAGMGPAGFDPPGTWSYTPPAPYDAASFDIGSRTYSTDAASGQLVSVHPVDQAVALAVGIDLGSLASMPNSGINRKRIRDARRETVQSVINDEVSSALKALVASGDVSLLGSPLMPDANGRPWFFVDYVNLRLPRGASPAPLPIRI